VHEFWDQVIERRLWRERDKPFATFGEFALAPPPSGLGVYNDRALALLKAALDHKGTHVEEWSDVLVEVEKAITVRQIEHVSPDNNFKARGKKSIEHAPGRAHSLRLPLKLLNELSSCHLPVRRTRAELFLKCRPRDERGDEREACSGKAFMVGEHAAEPAEPQCARFHRGLHVGIGERQ
jgi:hypothetical protein